MNTLYTTLIITPVSPKALPNYLEQLHLNQHLSKPICWDSDNEKFAKVGDLFGFYFHKKYVDIHEITDVLSPKYRLDTWSKEKKHAQRNVILLSEVLYTVYWNDWIRIGGAKNIPKTQSVKKNIKDILLHININYKH